MKEIVFFLEEASAQAMLEGVLPRIIDTHEISVRYVVFEGKSDLENQLERRIRGYLNPEARFLVMRDQDSAPDCRAIKQRLVDKCVRAGKPDAVVRIACRELETIYLADMAAVEKGLETTGLARMQTKKYFRLPDSESVSPWKLLHTITRGGYQNVAGSRAIGPHLDLENERSPTFRHLLAGIRRLAAD